MSDSTMEPNLGLDSGRTRGKLSFRLAPWAALAVVAAAAFWPRAKRDGMAEAKPPRALTPAEHNAAQPGRGRCARGPWAIPLLGWKDILWRTYREMGRDRLSALAGGATFYILLATFPGLAAFVSLYGLFSDVGTVTHQISRLSSFLPRDAAGLIGGQMLRLAAHRTTTLSTAFVISTLLSAWSANAAMKALVDGLNITFDEVEKRDYVRRSLFTYAATLSALVFLALVLSVLVGAPVFFHQMGWRHTIFWWGPLRWLAVFFIAAGGFTLLYRFGPSRVQPQWRWVVFGGFLAALAWMAASLAFSWYVNNVAHFGMIYGSLSAFIAYMLWVWVTAMVVLTGGELNAEVEHQTAIDTTIGPPKRMGERGAVMADTLGKAFTTSPREAATWCADFGRRQVGYVVNFLRRMVGLA